MEFALIYIYRFIFNEIQITRALFCFSMCFQWVTGMRILPEKSEVNITQFYLKYRRIWPEMPLPCVRIEKTMGNCTAK